MLLGHEKSVATGIRSESLESPHVVVPNGTLRMVGGKASRGRNAGYPAPPAQIRTSGTTAYGSYLG
jgi:hypothetical protein